MRQGATSAVPGDMSLSDGERLNMIHENETQGRPHVSVIREDGSFVWEMRQASLIPIRRSAGHFPTSAKAQAAGDRALARLCPTNS